jgi:metalloendopeptidase OMA1, mitochondrial
VKLSIVKVGAVVFVLFCFLVSACVTIPETGGHAFILTSENQEAALGEQAFRETLSTERLSTNRRWAEILERVGRRIAEASRKSDYQWEFKLVESKEKNAFCLPGGKVAFYTGIFSVAQNEAALAAVMGHEVAHATARHGGQRMTLSFGTGLAFEGLSAILGGGGGTRQKQLLLGALGLGTKLGVALPFSRGNESEADRIGLVYMARAGYDPAEAPRFWQRFGQEGRTPPQFLSTHPASEERMQSLIEQQAEVRSLYSRSPQYGLGETL